jgi:hypothetical protein
MLKFAVEDYHSALAELTRYYQAHHDEVGPKGFPMDPDYESYSEYADLGMLHVVTARLGAELVGYHVSIVTGALHYRSCVTALVDGYYLRPDCRKGMNGINFLKFVDLSLQSIGVNRVYTTTTAHSNKGAIFERLGYTAHELTYTKTFGVQS